MTMVTTRTLLNHLFLIPMLLGPEAYPTINHAREFPDHAQRIKKICKNEILFPRDPY